MIENQPHRRRRQVLSALLGLALAASASAAVGPAAAASASVPYPAHTSRPQASASRHRSARKPGLRGNPARAELAFQAMQRYYYILGSGLYQGEPFSSLWPFSQALAATVSMASIPGLKGSFAHEVQARLVGLRSYLDTTNSGASEGTYTSSLSAFDATVAPPAGPGGAKFYDDNDWVGIELARLYELTRSAPALQYAEQIMAFEMAGWQTDPEVACPGGIPFSNSAENTERNTVTNAPAAEFAVQLYRITHNIQYLQFAQMTYEWVRACLLQPGDLYADHILPHGEVDTTLWSYNQGAMIGAGTLLFKATGNGAYLYEARQTARAALAHFSPQVLRAENPFFPSVFLRNLLYLDSVTRDPPGAKLVQAYVNYAWSYERQSDGLFVAGSPPTAELLAQAAIVQLYALLSSPPSTYF